MCCLCRTKTKTKQMALKNLTSKLDKSGKLFCKQPLIGVVENGVLKIKAKSLKIVSETVVFPLIIAFKTKNHIKHAFVYNIDFFFFFNTAREYEKSYKINYVVHFGLNTFSRRRPTGIFWNFLCRFFKFFYVFYVEENSFVKFYWVWLAFE